MYILLLISWLLAIAMFGYLTSLVTLVVRMKRTQTEYWEYLGSPNMTDPNGQVVILWKVIFGTDLPDSVASSHKKGLLLVRILLALSITLFSAIAAMAYLKANS